MALAWTENVPLAAAAHGCTALYALKTLALAQGWTVPRSSDGVSAGAADYIVAEAVLTNAWAWFVLSGPGGREILFSRSGGFDSASWLVVYSRAAGFAGGAVGANPTAADEAVLRGTLPATSATLWTYFAGYAHMAVSDADDSFWLVEALGGSAQARTLVFCDVLSEVPAPDTDPAVLGALYNTSASAFASNYFFNDGAQAPSAWFDAGGASEAFQTCGVLNYGIQVSTGLCPAGGTASLGTSINGSDVLLPIFYARRSTLAPPGGFKGKSGLGWHTLGTARAAGDTLSVATARDYLVLGDLKVALPWGGVVPLV